MSDEGTSLRPSDAHNDPRQWNEIDHAAAQELAEMPFEKAVSTILTPDKIDRDTKVDMHRRPITLNNTIETVLIPTCGGYTINHVVVRAVGRMLSDPALGKCADALLVAKTVSQELSEDEQAELQQSRLYIPSSKIIKGTRTKYQAWEPNVLSMLGGVTKRIGVHGTTLAIIYMSIDLLGSGLPIGKTAEKVFAREAENWADWLDFTTRRFLRLM